MGLGGRVEVVMVNKHSKFGWNPFDSVEFIKIIRIFLSIKGA